MGNRTENTEVKRKEERTMKRLTHVNSEWPFALREYKQSIKKYQEPPKRPTEEIDKVFEYTNSEKDWENAVDCITYVEKTKLGGLLVYVKWKNGYKSIHHWTEVRSKCPQKVIPFFLRLFFFLT